MFNTQLQSVSIPKNQWGLIFNILTERIQSQFLCDAAEMEIKKVCVLDMHNSILDESIDLRRYYKGYMAAQTTVMIC